jgi:hypothetical protein
MKNKEEIIKNYKSPKYQIGDTIVFIDSIIGDSVQLLQGVINQANAYNENPNGFDWYYDVIDVEGEGNIEPIEEDCIIEKLN